MASRVLTISIGNECIKICDAAYTQQKVVHVRSVITVPTPEATFDDGFVRDIPAIAAVIKDAVNASGLTCKDVIFSMQSSKIASKEVLTPVLKGSKLDTFIKTNATEYFPVNIDEYVFTHSVLEVVEDENGGKSTRVMVAAVPLNYAESYYDLAAYMGYNVVALDYLGNSTLQIIKLQIDEAPSIVIQMGDESTTISILKNNVLQLMRTVSYGKNVVANAIMEAKDLSYQEAVEMMTSHQIIKPSMNENDPITDSLRYLINNIGRIMDYYITKNANNVIEKAYLLPEGKNIVGIEDLLSYELNINVESIKTLKRVVMESYIRIPDSEFNTYLTNIGAVINPVNFLPRSAEARAKSQQSSRYVRMIFVGAMALSVLLVIVPLIGNIARQTQKAGLKKNINSIKSVQKTVDEYYYAKDRYSDMETFLTVAQNNNDCMVDFIAFLEEKMPSDVSITNLSSDSGSVTMSFACSSKETLAQLVAVLEEKENVANVNVPAFSEAVDQFGAVTLSGTLSCTIVDLGEAVDASVEDESKGTDDAKETKADEADK